MGLYHFNEITAEHSFLGGKGLALGLLKNTGMNVPDGLILTKMPTTENEWNDIFSWWEKNDLKKLAIRSSALGEDSKEHSFAGQNSSFLNIDNQLDIKKSVEKCFQSIFKQSSTLYREHFLKIDSSKELMNVVLQIMVEPKYSGVFFSTDPRGGETGWIVEAIEGLGEDLVSGKKTPLHFAEKNSPQTKFFDLDELVKVGLKVKDFFKTEIDMEWAIDEHNQIKVLQARPITALVGKSEEKRLIAEEIKRLKLKHSIDTIWDGNTFSEWPGTPSELTFSIWQKAFAKGEAFSIALKKLGYLGINEELKNEEHSLLEKIFDKAYVNISMLAPLYFGPMPYRLCLKKSPKLKFDFKKMNLKTILLTPVTILRIIMVSFRLSTQRRKWLNDAASELGLYRSKSFRSKNTESYANIKDSELFEKFNIEIKEFHRQHLVWPLVLITLIESTTANLKALLKGVVDDLEIEKLVNHWMSLGIHTVTMEMNLAYKNASTHNDERELFYEKFGHRGPSELDLKNPRWIELKDKAFFSSMNKKSEQNEKNVEDKSQLVKEEILALKTYKKEVILKEWLLLKEMLELREEWKMAILSPYSHIRFIALEIQKRNHLKDDAIFWLTYSEILSKNFNAELISNRINLAKLCKNIYLPGLVELKKIDSILNGKVEKENNSIFNGVPLSPGLVCGEIRVVTNPESVNTDNWPINTILVAESTDPGWTGLFLKSIGVIVEKGGVLSHCAIVAREMNLPAISGIKQCHLKFKDGDKVWIDGNNGRITLA